MENTTLEPPPSVGPSEMQQEAKSPRKVATNNYTNYYYCTFYNSEKKQLSHIQHLARRGFGEFCLDLERLITRDQAVTLATWFEYPPAKIEGIQTTECDPPSRVFVQTMAERGEISSSDISALIRALESDAVKLNGVATKVKEAFCNHVGQAQVSASDEGGTDARGKFRRPPEVAAKENRRPTDEKPFVLQKIKGNIKKCIGCRKQFYRKGSLPIKIPKNMTIGHFEQRKFFSKALGKEVEMPGNVYYHVNLSCIRLRNPDFSPDKIVIPPGVTLTEEHYNYFESCGISVPR